MKKIFKVCTIFDTETCNYGDGKDTRAYPVLYILNDLKDIDLNNYEIDKSDNIVFYRYDYQVLSYINNLIKWGENHNIIPIITAYNLMFDLQTLLYNLCKNYKMNVNAQSSTNVYTVDIVDEEENILLRFWDCFHLEMNGLETMGKIAGVEKAKGSWNYDLVRTPETQLTEDELFYAKRDVQVIPAYLNYLLKANDFIKADMLGFRVITKTSIVRQMAYKKIGNNKINLQSGKKLSLVKAYEFLCKKQLPKTYQSYALRKACFRGGLTFTSANYAHKTQQNVASLDVTSMHHAFICGRFIPINFNFIKSKKIKNILIEYIFRQSTQDVLDNYQKPFEIAGHFKIEFKNLRLKKDSCFEKWGISTLAQAKFDYNAVYDDYSNNECNIQAEKEIKKNKYIDACQYFKFGFGKLFKAKKAVLHLNEYELWIINQVYDFDKYKCLEAEVTRKFMRAPDYVTLQSCTLYKMKNDLKEILKNYKEGIPYNNKISDSIPVDLSKLIKEGKLSNNFLESYYNSTVKGMFNGIYGTQAQDIFKPNFAINENAEIFVDEKTKTTPGNFSLEGKENSKVLYTYGMRIVAGSRMHLIIAMQMLYNKLGNKIDILGGDTDSLKVRCDSDINSNDLIDALDDLHFSITKAIDYTMWRVKKNYPKLYDKLLDVGCFECENSNDFYTKHIELWNKARISLKRDGKLNITCAGVPQPDFRYNINNFMSDMLKKYSFEQIATYIIGFNVFISPKISNYLQKHKPHYDNTFSANVKDYNNNQTNVNTYEAISLYLTGRWLGESTKLTNRYTIKYLNEIGVKVDTRDKYLDLIDNKPQITIMVGDKIDQIL